MSAARRMKPSLRRMAKRFGSAFAARITSPSSTATVVITTAGHEIVGHVKQESPFCPDIAATPDGNQVWLTLKDVGKTMAFNARCRARIFRAVRAPLQNSSQPWTSFPPIAFRLRRIVEGKHGNRRAG